MNTTTNAPRLGLAGLRAQFERARPGVPVETLAAWEGPDGSALAVFGRAGAMNTYHYFLLLEDGSYKPGYTVLEIGQAEAPMREHARAIATFAGAREVPV